MAIRHTYRCGLLLFDTDRVAWSVGLSVFLPDTLVIPSKTAEPIKMPFGLWTQVDPKYHVLDGV